MAGTRSATGSRTGASGGAAAGSGRLSSSRRRLASAFRRTRPGRSEGGDTGCARRARRGSSHRSRKGVEGGSLGAASRSSNRGEKSSAAKRDRKRRGLALRMRQIRRIEKRKRREERRRLEEELGPDAPPKGVPRTLENMRAFDETYVMGADKEVEDEEMMDEFSDHYLGRTSPKIFITTSLKYTKLCREFVRHLALLFPNAQVYPRKKYSVGVLIDYAIRNGFTDLLVVNEDHKQLNGMIHCHLPGGPTAIFRLSSVKMLKEIGKVKLHSPELILNNFTTRLGRTIGRMLGALVPLTPEFEGRRVITIHNQRDYIFFRHHIYEFEGPAAANLRELGPSFTLKLKSLQSGLFDKKHGEYLFQHKRENQPYSRKKFVL